MVSDACARCAADSVSNDIGATKPQERVERSFFLCHKYSSYSVMKMILEFLARIEVLTDETFVDFTDPPCDDACTLAGYSTKTV